MTDLIEQITSDFQKQINEFKPDVSVSDIGTVLEAGDGIARVEGLANIKSQELVQFANGVIGIAFNLERDSVGVIGDSVHGERLARSCAACAYRAARPQPVMEYRAQWSKLSCQSMVWPSALRNVAATSESIARPTIPRRASALA